MPTVDDTSITPPSVAHSRVLFDDLVPSAFEARTGAGSTRELAIPSRRDVDRAAISAGARIRSVLIVDQEPFLTSLGRSFGDLGYEVWIESSSAAAMGTIRMSLPDLVVLAVTTADQPAREMIAEARRTNPRCLIALTTFNPSIATATEATRLGVDAYLTKPVSAPLVLSMLDATDTIGVGPEVELSWPSLDRAIWDYLNQVFVAAGSMSEAARRLRVDRRSLRRMLAKSPPPV
jgi:two-component system, response regulator RegA